METVKYHSPEEKKQAKREKDRRYREKHREQIRIRNRTAYRKKHPVKKKDDKEPRTKGLWKCRKYETEEQRQMYQRADHLARNYKRIDAKKGYDISNNVDGNWIYEHILTRKCLYCHREDWKMLGCDRIDNSKPHTPDNVVPCCKPCNDDRHQEEFLHYFLASYVIHFIQD